MGWTYFIQEPCKENEHWVRKLYSNLIVVKVSNPVMRIGGKEVHFGAEQINRVYRLQEIDMRDYETKDYTHRS